MGFTSDEYNGASTMVSETPKRYRIKDIKVEGVRMIDERICIVGWIEWVTLSHYQVHL